MKQLFRHVDQRIKNIYELFNNIYIINSLNCNPFCCNPLKTVTNFAYKGSEITSTIEDIRIWNARGALNKITLTWK